MSNRLQRIELAARVPGPVPMDLPLQDIEIYLLRKINPELVIQINQGLLWQDN